MKQKVNIGFLGIGSYSVKQHIPNAFRNPIFNIYAFCDLKEERLQKYGKLYNPCKMTTDYKTLIADPDLDMIVIAMSPDLHARFAIEFLEAGKDVFVEKPLAEDAKTAMEVARVARKNNRKLAVGYNRRFSPAYIDVRDLLDCDKGPVMINYRMVNDDRDSPAWANNRPRLLDEACHIFDICNWFAKSDPVSIYACEHGRPQDNHIITEYENGVTSAIFMSSFGAFDWPKERVEIVGDRKVVAVEDFVELQTAGIPGWTHKNYAGLEYDGFSKGYSKAYERGGLPFYREMRRMMAELILDSNLIKTSPDLEKWELISTMYPDQIRIPINYSCDKGWYSALDHFGKCILENTQPHNAGAVDGAKTTVMGLAAMKSIKLRQPVMLDKSSWTM